MDPKKSWLYPKDLKEAKVAQEEMAKQVILKDSFSAISLLGGMDVSCNLYDKENLIYAATVCLDKNSLKLIDQASLKEVQVFPYIPGFLGFREAPALIHSFQKLEKKPDLIIIDGHGISHPRGLGIASHIGVYLDIPTIGVAKSLLCGKMQNILSDEVGSVEPVIWQNKVIAFAYRSKKRSLPIFISPGHKISLETAFSLVKETITKYRLPETNRLAHLAANLCRKTLNQ